MRLAARLQNQVGVVLGTTDTILHFFYNALTYAAILAAFVYVRRSGRPMPEPVRVPAAI